MKQNFRKTFANIAITAVMALTGMNANAQISDRVLVVVNDDVITQSEFDFRLANVQADAARAGQPLPEDVNDQVIESMINDRLQLQEAERRELVVSDEEVDASIAQFAEQQGQTVAEFEASLDNSGDALALFRQTVRDSLTISLLTEFYTNNRVFVPEYEVDGAMSQNNLGEAAIEYQVAHLFVKDVDASREKAADIRDEIVNGLDFSEAVTKYSEGPGVESGGLIGWRTVDALPELFATAIKDAEIGAVSEVLESPNGLHILKLVDRKGQRIEIIQSKVRHILIEAESDVARKQAKKKLIDIKQQVLDGADFSELARIYSDDSVSAADGGSLDWVNPGQMVQPFEDMYETLDIGEVSEPVDTQFGVHIIQVEDRRNENVTELVMRNRVRGVLRRQRASREFTQWVQQLKEQAYINHLTDPAS